MATRLQRLRRGELGEAFPFAGPAFRRAAPWLLAAVFALALATRLHPALRFAVWGSDSGEYQFLTRRLVDTGRISFDYDGWGLAYPYFPGMFVVSGAVTAVLGVDVFHATQWTTPALAALVPPLLGLLAYRATSDPRVGVVAAAFAATTSTLVMTTSHAMPGTLGQVLLVGLVCLLPDAERESRHLVVLGVLAVALVLTHHLTTYFAIGIVAFTAFLREMTQRATDTVRLRANLTVGGLLLVLAALWWLVVAEPFREEIVGDALPFHPVVTTLLFLLGLGLLPALVWWKRQRSDWHWRPRYPDFPRQWTTALAMGLGLWLVVLFIVAVKLPGSTITISPLALLFVVPVLAFLAFLPLGHSALRFHRNGVVVFGWLYAVLASLAFAIATNSHVLFPFRHVDYMVMGMAPLAAFGMLMVYDQTLASKVPAERPRARAVLVGVVTGLVVLSALLSLPPREVIGGFEEGISTAELRAVEWVRDHPEAVPRNATIAADHRVSSLLFGLAGAHPTWDFTPRTYHAENATEALDELRQVHVPGLGDARVDYVLVSPDIERGVTLVQWENSRPMSAAAIAKFDDAAAFEKVYDVDGVRIYRVLWGAT